MNTKMLRVVFSPFIWLFFMPPVEKRPKIKGFIRYFIYMDYDREFDEAYAYYKVFILNLWLNIFFISAYLFSFVTQKNVNLLLFQIQYRRQAPVDELVYGYPLYVFPILVVVTVLYSALLFFLKTDYLSKERIITERIPVLDSNKQLYGFRPHKFIIAFIVFTILGFCIWSIPWLLREYTLYNFLHDFRSHSLDNFFVYAFLYFVAYQTIFSQSFVIVTVNMVRSVLRHWIYRVNNSDQK